MTVKRTPAYDRVMAKCVAAENGCLIYTGGLNWVGYGQAWRDGKNMGAHKVVWEHHNGPVPEGMEIDHVAARGCTSRACCNIDHLEVVTPEENARRRRRKVCKKGLHELSGYNEAFFGTEPSRMCRQCALDRTREWKRARRAAAKAAKEAA